ncbi:MAG: helicase-related protein, partial [Thiomonas sp.]
EPPAAPPRGFAPTSERPVIDEAALGRAGVFPPAPAPIINERALAPAAPTPSQQMGLNPAAGPMSAAAALAVDTGASATMQQAAQAVDPETGEILETGARVPEQKQATDTPEQMRERLGFIEQQARANGGWDRRLIEERDRLQAELAKAEPAADQFRDATEMIEPAPAIDVSGRTDEQLRVLEKAGRDGWREAAVAEIQRRAAQQPAAAPELETQPVAADAPTMAAPQAYAAPVADIKTVIAKQIPDMTEGELQQAISHYGPAHKRTAKLQKELQKRGQGVQTTAAIAPGDSVQVADGLGSDVDGQPGRVVSVRGDTASVEVAGERYDDVPVSELKKQASAAASEGWDGMTAEQRAAVLTKPGGWSTAKGKLNVIGKQIAGRNWSAINPTTRATIERLMQGEQTANVPTAEQVAPQAQEARGQEGEAAGEWAGIGAVAAQPAAAKFDSQSGTTRTQAERDLWEKGAENERAESDVGVTAGTQVRFVPLADAVATVREAEQAGVQMTPFQVHQATGIRVGDAERVIREARSPAASEPTQPPADAARTDERTTTQPEAPEFTTLKDRDGKTVTVRTADLSGARERMPMFTKDGKRKTTWIHRDNLDPTGEKQAEGAKEMADNPFFNVITTKDGSAFASEAAAERELRRRGLQETHEVVPASEVSARSSGFVVRRAEAAEQQQPEPAAAEASAATADVPAADAVTPEQTQAAVADRFANNKLFTADKVAAARARMKAKLGTLNSGIDPDLLVDGMTIAGAYIESGIRNFTQYAKTMIDDMGDGVKPYLLSFWEGARNYPGLDTKDMTSAEESRRQFDALLTPEDLKTDAVGEIAEKPKKRSRKSGEKGDMVLTQDWGVETIDGYGDGALEVGNDTKDAFLKEARNYLNAVADQLRAFGFEPHADGKGKSSKPVRSNEAGAAVSGDVSLTMRNAETGQNVYIHIGDTPLRGSVPVTPSGIAVMFRTGNTESEFVTGGTSQWAPVDLSAKDLAQLVNESAAANKPARVSAQQEKRKNEPAADGAQDQGRAEAVRGGGGSDSQQDPAPTDTRDVAPRQPEDGRPAGEAGDSGRSGVRVPRADVARGEGVPQGRVSGNGRARAGGAGSPDAGAGGAGSAGELGGVSSPAATSAQAQDLHVDNPLEIVGGSPVQRFNRNRAALELLQTLTEEGRQATPDEQKVLAGYIGWGSFGQELFQGSWERPAYKDEGIWKERGQWLRDTLGESAWKSAQRSITNAHYTDPPTVLAMWDMVRRMGFEGGKVLEPSMGTGNFFSMMPADLKARSQLTGIELDETTGAIAKQLFPRSNVRIMGYQDSKTPDGFYDLIIGNWPFENTPVADRRYNKLNPMLHDYFFLKTMDQVRPGGIVIGITSAGSMDKQNTTIRRELAKQAELVAAIRLPSGAFEEYAGTKVVTDIVVLRKRPQRLVATPSDATWVETGDYKTPAGETIKVNRYYLDNPQNIIGTLDFGSGTTTFRAGMIVRRPENMAEQLQKAIELVPQGAMLARGKVDHLTYYANETGERHGALALVNDRLMIAVGDQLVEANEASKYVLKDAKKTAVREQQLHAAIDLRKKHAALVDAERGGRPADDARKALRTAYKAFTSEHGALRDSYALSYLDKINDPFFAELAALENDDGTPAAVMERSTTRGRRAIDNPSVRDAYVLARNQSVNPSVAEVARLAGKSEQAVKAELLDSGAVFEAPNGDVVPSDIYLSGNVRQKMREARVALDEGNAAMRANVAALKEVMPEDVPYFNIETQFGATWVPNEAYAQYVAHMLGQSSPKGIEVSFRAGRWKVKMEPGLSRIPEAAANYGTPGYPFSRLVQAAISNQVLRLTSKDENGNDVYDAERTEEANARIAKIREDFGAWLWSDPERRQDLEREYNEARNSWATPTYDGSFLTFEGMALTLGNGAFQLRQHQVNAIWRAIVNRRSINAHEVGTGKTFTMGGIAVESRRYGIAKKPMLLAHNANSATVAAEIRMMYPSARVLYVDNLQGDKKEIRLRQIANDDWDVIVVPHSLISSLALREETMMRMAEDDIKALEAEFFDAAREDNINPDAIDLDDDEDIAKIRSVTAKELAKARKRIIENIKKQAQKSSKEGAIAFEDLGVDMILVDEAHEFKKPPIVTRMKMKGLNTQVSNRSIALQFLTRYVRQMNNGGNVHTFTGTPITNTITEIYHQMRYVMEAEMEQATIADWDGWFGSFAAEVQDVELTAAGDYEMVSRLAGFVNVPELRAMVGQYMDTVFAEDMPEMRPRKVNGKELSDPALTEAERAELLNGRTEGAKDRPYKKVVNDSADMTAEQMRIFTRLQQYAREWRAATGKQKKEWMRAGDPRSPIITEGIANKASFDVRLLDDEGFAGQEGRVPDEPTSKASRVVKNVLEIYNSHPNANQVIFSETGFGKRATRSAGVHDGEKQKFTVPVFATMHDIVERLVQGGIPREQIAIVDGSTSKERRKEIAEAMNSSKIRIVIGSTDTLGVGVNMQRNLRAMHHVDAPYMPGELEQRNGRGLRQGNQWNTVLEYRYMTDRLDGKRWQILAVKQRFINAFMKAAAGTRVIEGEAAADEQSDILESFSEAAGDPRILQRVKMQKKLETLHRKERMYTQGIADMRRQERSSAEIADRLTRELKQLADSRTQANVEALIASQQQAFAATIDGTTYDTRKDAADALQAFIEANVRIGDSMKTVGEYAGHPLRIEWPRHMDVPVTQIDAFGQEFAGKGIAGAEAKMRNFPSVIENKTKRRDMERSTAENMRAAMNQPFAQAADLERITKQLQDLEKDLEINPVPPPAWLRQGAPIDSEVHRNKRPYIVTGHRYSKEGWFVIAEDDKGTVLIPYMEATDEVGMPMYEEREFVPPVVIETKKEDAAPADAPADVVVDRAAQSATTNPLRNADGTFARQDPAGDSLAFSATLPRDRNAVRIGITEKGLVRAMHLQFDGLAEITGKLLERGRAGKRGGVIVVGTADNAEIGRIVAERTGRKLDSTMRKFSSAGRLNGFYDPKTGLTFLVGPNLNPVTATAVMLHEMMHGQQRQKIDARALEMVRNRHSLKDEDLRAFLNRVMLRMIAAGEVGNAAEASAYIVEQAVIEGRSAGYTFADGAFMQWVDAKIGKRVGDFLRSFAGMIRTWMLRNGLGAKTMTVDDFVGYAMAGLDRAAAGEVRG